MTPTQLDALPIEQHRRSITEMNEKKRMLSHRITSQFGLLSNNPSFEGVDVRTCTCPTLTKFQTTVEELAERDMKQVQKINVNELVDLTHRIECSIKQTMFNPHDAKEISKDIKEALNNARAMSDTALEMKKISTREKIIFRSIVRQSNKT